MQVMFNHEETSVQSTFQSASVSPEGQGVEKKFVYCESKREEVFQGWLRAQLMRRLIRNDAVKEAVS